MEHTLQVRARVNVLVLAAAVALSAAMVLPAAAGATFDGTNGPVLFQRDPNLNNGDHSQIFSASPGARKGKRLTRLRGVNWFPDSSPNGRRIVFTHTSKTRDALITVRRDGSHRRRLHTGCKGKCLGDSSAAFSPNGKRIVFERAYGPVINDTAARVELRIARANGRHSHPIHLAIGKREPHDAQWAPNGRHLAVNVLNVGNTKPEAGSAIYVFKPSGRGLKRITPTRLAAGSPDWGPNGRRIVFNSFYEGQGLSEIYTVGKDGSALHRVRRQRHGHVAFEASFSPDGKRIAFSKASAKHPPHIWTMKRDGTQLRQLTFGRVLDVQADWSSRGAA